MLKKALILLVVAIALGFGALAALPSHIIVREGMDAELRTEELRAYVYDLKNWPDWLVWSGEEGAGDFQFSEKTTGVGAWMSWKKGEGRRKVTIKKIVPEIGLVYDLDYPGFPPAEGQVTVRESEGGLTTLAMGVTGELPFVSRLFRSALEAEISREFDRSLEKLGERFQETN